MTRLTEWTSEDDHRSTLRQALRRAQEDNLATLRRVMAENGVVALVARIPGPDGTPVMPGSLRFIGADGRPIALSDVAARLVRVFVEDESQGP